MVPCAQAAVFFLGVPKPLLVRWESEKPLEVEWSEVQATFFFHGVPEPVVVRWESEKPLQVRIRTNLTCPDLICPDLMCPDLRSDLPRFYLPVVRSALPAHRKQGTIKNSTVLAIPYLQEGSPPGPLRAVAYLHTGSQEP